MGRACKRTQEGHVTAAFKKQNKKPELINIIIIIPLARTPHHSRVCLQPAVPPNSASSFASCFACTCRPQLSKSSNGRAKKCSPPTEIPIARPAKPSEARGHLQWKSNLPSASCRPNLLLFRPFGQRESGGRRWEFISGGNSQTLLWVDCKRKSGRSH